MKDLYQPDFNNPKVKDRCIKALAFVDSWLKPGVIKSLSRTLFTKSFGNTSRPLALWLRNELIIVVDSRWNKDRGQCKKYTRNVEGVENLKLQLGIKQVRDYKVTEEISQQLASGDFEYTEKSLREYHPLQNYPKIVKRSILNKSGMTYEYDIQSAAQTLIVQYAQQLGYQIPMPHLESLLGDKTSIRNQLAKDLGLDTIQIKKLLHALLFGAKISTRHDNQIFALVNWNKFMIEHIRNNQWITDYRNELRSLWKFIRSKRNIARGQRLNAKLRSEIYRELEKSVRSVIQRYLKITKNKHFFEHDGWSCEKVVDITELRFKVKSETGYTINLDWTIYE